MADRPPIRRCWVLASPAVGDGDEQGHLDLYWNEDDQDWSACPDEATEYTAAGRDAVDLSVSGGDVEWWKRQTT